MLVNITQLFASALLNAQIAKIIWRRAISYNHGFSTIGF